MLYDPDSGCMGQRHFEMHSSMSTVGAISIELCRSLFLYMTVLSRVRMSTRMCGNQK